MASLMYVLSWFGHGDSKGSSAGQQGGTSGLKRCSFWMKAVRDYIAGWLRTQRGSVFFGCVSNNPRVIHNVEIVEDISTSICSFSIPSGRSLSKF